VPNNPALEKLRTDITQMESLLPKDLLPFGESHYPVNTVSIPIEDEDDDGKNQVIHKSVVDTQIIEEIDKCMTNDETFVSGAYDPDVAADGPRQRMRTDSELVSAQICAHAYSWCRRRHNDSHQLIVRQVATTGDKQMRCRRRRRKSCNDAVSGRLNVCWPTNVRLCIRRNSAGRTRIVHNPANGVRALQVIPKMCVWRRLYLYSSTMPVRYEMHENEHLCVYAYNGRASFA
jgi:hypothetical protein